MLKTRVLPIVLLRDYNVVKSIQFSTFRTIGSPITVSRIYDNRGVDELILLDITATPEKRAANLEIVAEISKECFMPLTVGGGVRSITEAANLLASGADKVSLNTAAVENPKIITELSNEFGSQCIVASIDYKQLSNGESRVIVNSGKRETALHPLDWAKKVEELGAGEILLNSIENDGKMHGYDIAMIKAISSAVSIPVIACGGAGKPEDFSLAIIEGGASAVAAASVYHFTSITPQLVKEHLHQRGVPVRLEK